MSTIENDRLTSEVGYKGTGNHVQQVTPAGTMALVNPSIDYSIIRSKNVLVSPTEEQYELIRRRLHERIIDSRGETIYEIGIGEDGSGDNGLDPDEYAASVATLQSLASTLNADCVELRQRKGEKGLTGQYLVRQRVDQSDFMEIR